jgi:hypothetical protein
MLHTQTCGGRSFNRRRSLKEGSHLTLDSLQGEHAPPFEPSRAPSGNSLVETLFAFSHAQFGLVCLLTLVTAAKRDLISCRTRANSVKEDLTSNFANVSQLVQLTIVAAALADGHARIAECDQRSCYFS